ncbi:MAG: OmpA family protein [Desulforhopalus sp.]|nr:OmpA family protein [Desulforhopalus sp.]
MLQTKKIWTLLTAGAALLGLMASPVLAIEVVVTVEEVFEKTVDNVIVLYDSSGSMSEKYGNTDLTRLEAERMILLETNSSLPDLDWNMSFYSFTPKAFSLDSLAGSTEDIPPITPYSKESVAKAIEALPAKASGPTFLQHALKKVGLMMPDLKGKTAIIVFTDGTYTKMGSTDTPLTLAQKLVKNYDTCIYAVSSATGEKEQALIKAMSQLNECSMVIPFNELLGHPGYTTGALYKVIEKTVAIDIVDGILFDFNESVLKDQYHGKLQELGTFLETNTNVHLFLAGYTDGVGSEGYNMVLSKERSESVRDYLLAHSNIDKNRVTLQWYGKADPISSNQTEEGRALNRRVSVILTNM